MLNLFFGPTSVLCYIRNEDKSFHTFVANKISAIHDGSKPYQWRYVDTKLNPADDASRGISIDNLLNSTRWMKGPDFLWEHKTMWPSSSMSFIKIPEDDAEVKRTVSSYSTHRDVKEGMTRLVF